MIEQSNREAKEISGRAGEIYNQVCLVAERLHRLGNTLKAANNHYNDAVKGLAGKQGLYGKIERFQQLSTTANKEMMALGPLHTDIENDRLENLGSGDEAGATPATVEGSGEPDDKIKPIKSAMLQDN